MLRRAGPAEAFPAYTPAELEKLSEQFTSKQQAAIEASERSVLGEDLFRQARLRRDTHLPEYLDDYAMTLPGIDREPDEPFDLMPPGYDWHQHVLEHTSEDMKKSFAQLGRQQADERRRRKKGEPVQRLSKEEQDKWKHSLTQAMLADSGPDAFAPEAARTTTDENGKLKERRKSREEMLQEEAREVRDPGGKMVKAGQQVGLDERGVRDLKTKILLSKSVINVTMLGRVQSTFVLAMAGTGDGRLGIGQAKGLDAIEATRQARLRAVRSMKPVPRYESRTIYGNTEAKVSATVVQLMHRPPGSSFPLSYFLAGYL